MTEDAIRKNISENLVRLRTRSGMTQAQLAQKLHYSDKSVSKWERGEGVPDVMVLAALAEEFGVTVSGLIGEDVPSAPAADEAGARGKDAPFWPRWLLTLLLAVCLCYLCAFILFDSPRVVFPGMPHRWVLFLFAAFASAGVMTVLFSLWDIKPARLASLSLALWSAGLSLHFTVSLFPGWAILCGILQVLIVLIFLRRDGLACVWPPAAKKDRERA